MSLQLTQRYGGQFISERTLRQQHGFSMYGRETHISDGEFLCRGKRFAIEVELNKKSERRRDKIFHHYAQQFEYDGVWYFCGNNEVYHQWQSYAEKADWLTRYDLQAFLSNEVTLHVL